MGTESQGGSQAECQAILNALGVTEAVSSGTNDPGYGCHYWDSYGYWWLSNTDFDPAASNSSARIVCGCLD